jgi:hypothetical protein
MVIDRMTTDIVASVVRRLDPAKNAAAPNTAPNVDTSNVNMDTNVDSSGNGGFNPLDELPF